MYLILQEDFKLIRGIINNIGNKNNNNNKKKKKKSINNNNNNNNNDNNNNKSALIKMNDGLWRSK